MIISSSPIPSLAIVLREELWPVLRKGTGHRSILFPHCSIFSSSRENLQVNLKHLLNVVNYKDSPLDYPTKQPSTGPRFQYHLKHWNRPEAVAVVPMFRKTNGWDPNRPMTMACCYAVSRDHQCLGRMKSWIRTFKLFDIQDKRVFCAKHRIGHVLCTFSGNRTRKLNLIFKIFRNKMRHFTIFAHNTIQIIGKCYMHAK